MYLLAIVFFLFIPILSPFCKGVIIVFLLLFLISSAPSFDLLLANILKHHLSIMLIFMFSYIMVCQSLPYAFHLWWYVLKVSSRFYKYSHFLIIFLLFCFSNIQIINLRAVYFDVVFCYPQMINQSSQRRWFSLKRFFIPARKRHTFIYLGENRYNKWNYLSFDKSFLFI